MFSTLINKGSFIAIIISMFLLSGCSQLTGSSSSSFQNQLTNKSTYYLDKAKKAGKTEKVNWQLLAIQALIKEIKLSDAQAEMKRLPDMLRRNQSRELDLLRTELDIARNKIDLAEKRMNKLNRRLYSGAQRDRYYQARINLAKAKQANKPDLLALYIQAGKESTPFYQKTLIEDTWSFVKTFTAEDKKKSNARLKDNEVKGWLALLTVYETNRNDYTKLYNEVKKWRAKFSNHPAARNLPKELKREYPKVNVNDLNIALLLPLSGDVDVFGRTIKMGFDEAKRKDSKGEKIKVTVYDTQKQSIPSIVSAMQKAGINLIVGPLLKDDVNQLRLSQVKLPILGLNRIENIHGRTNLCYFALAPEDEAKQAANHIYQQGKKAPLLIIQKNEFGMRVAHAFAEQWMSNTKTNSARAQYYTSLNQLTADITKGLATNAEKVPVNYVPGIPSDMTQTDITAPIDAIYIVATQNESMVIKPLIDTKINKDDVSFYASSRSNNAGASIDFRYDMEGVQFTEIPMIANRFSEKGVVIPAAIQRDNSLIRLYAMGYDAWSLVLDYSNFNAGYRLDGQTGKISVNDDCVIMRDFPWLQYSKGNIQLAQ